jgi:hypothetical protein
MSRTSRICAQTKNTKNVNGLMASLYDWTVIMTYIARLISHKSAHCGNTKSMLFNLTMTFMQVPQKAQMNSKTVP